MKLIRQIVLTVTWTELLGTNNFEFGQDASVRPSGRMLKPLPPDPARHQDSAIATIFPIHSRCKGSISTTFAIQ